MSTGVAGHQDQAAGTAPTVFTEVLRRLQANVESGLPDMAESPDEGPGRGVLRRRAAPS